MQATWPGNTSSSHYEDLSKEQIKTPKTLADRFTAVFNKKGRSGMDVTVKHGGEVSTSSTKFSDRSVLQCLAQIGCSLVGKNIDNIINFNLQPRDQIQAPQIP